MYVDTTGDDSIGDWVTDEDEYGDECLEELHYVEPDAVPGQPSQAQHLRQSRRDLQGQTTSHQQMLHLPLYQPRNLASVMFKCQSQHLV